MDDGIVDAAAAEGHGFQHQFLHGRPACEQVQGQGSFPAVDPGNDFIDCLEGAFLDTHLGEGDHGFHDLRFDDAHEHNAHTETIYRLDNALYIDRHVWESTKAHNDVTLLTEDWAKYNSYFKALSAQLRKEVGEL